MKIVLILLSSGCVASCGLHPPHKEEISASITMERFSNALAEIIPENYEMRSDTLSVDGAWNGVQRVTIVDKQTPHYIRWENKNGLILSEKFGYKAIKFLISTSGDRRIGGLLSPDKEKVFYRSGTTFIYAFDGMVYESDEAEMRFDKILENARWTSPVPGSVNWRTWSSDIKRALRRSHIKSPE